MAKILGYNEIGYVAATFKVDATTIAKLKEMYLNTETQRVDVNGKNLGVVLKSDNTIGFGTSTPAVTDKLFGIMITYEQDGFATVMTKGYLEDVPTVGAVAINSNNLAVNDVGLITTVEGATTKANVIKAATSSDKSITVEF